MRAGTLSIALVHHPVIDRRGDEIASVIDEFDVFDGGRLALTYGVSRLYVVNPVPAQQAKAERIIAHGRSDQRDPSRGRMDALRWVPSLDEAVADCAQVGGAPWLLATSATRQDPVVSFGHVRRRRAAGAPVLLVIGKAWGLASSVFERCDARLEPIDGGTGFNHLSVRSAMAILLDRLCAPT